MILGTDTGFYIALSNDHPRAEQIWQEFVERQHNLIVSTLTLTEILIYFYRRGNSTVGRSLLHLILDFAGIQVVPVTVEIAVRSAGYRQSLNLSTVDSVILTTFLMHDCELALSSDSDFRLVDERGLLPVEFL